MRYGKIENRGSRFEYRIIRPIKHFFEFDLPVWLFSHFNQAWLYTIANFAKRERELRDQKHGE